MTKSTKLPKIQPNPAQRVGRLGLLCAARMNKAIENSCGLNRRYEGSNKALQPSALVSDKARLGTVKGMSRKKAWAYASLLAALVFEFDLNMLKFKSRLRKH